MKTRLKLSWLILMVMALTGLLPAARAFYGPAEQRWINRDPVEEVGGLNLYGFVHNNPLNAYDSTGLFASASCAAALAALAEFDANFPNIGASQALAAQRARLLAAVAAACTPPPPGPTPPTETCPVRHPPGLPPPPYFEPPINVGRNEPPREWSIKPPPISQGDVIFVLVMIGGVYVIIRLIPRPSPI